MTVLKCISYNINGLNNPIKRKKLLGELKKRQCSIAFIQETHLLTSEHTKLKWEWVEVVCSSSCSLGKKRGVAILFNKSIYFNTTKEIVDDEGRYVLVIGSISGKALTLLNIYRPNGDNPKLFKDLALLLAENAKGIIIIRL